MGSREDAINSLTWEDSRLVAPPGWGVTLHPEVNAGTPHGAALDMAFLSSVCPGHEESGLVSYGITRTNLEPSAIKLSTRRPRMSLYLFLAYTLDLDEQDGRFLAVTESTYSVGPSEERTAVRYHYVRNPSNEYPEAHLHIHGESARLGDMAKVGWKDRPSSRLHLPVGGRRFRPCLEDIIEFCVVEGLVEPENDEWNEVLDDHRDRFYRRQLKSAVRRDPHAAASALRYQGFRVSEPGNE